MNVSRFLRILSTRAQLVVEGVLGTEERNAPSDWYIEEAKFRRKMRASLRPSLRLGKEIEDLAFRVIKNTPAPSNPPHLFQVHATLTVRVLQDTRVASIAALNGYIMQSWTVASSAFESANMMGFIAKEPARAGKWLEHSSADRPFAGVYDTITGTLMYLGVGEDPRERKQFSDQEYKFYRQLCMAKHANPIPEREQYWVHAGTNVRLLFTPIFAPPRVRQAVLGLALANRAALTASWVYAKAHSPAYDGMLGQFTRLAERVVEELGAWKQQ